ncbi:hypothetical protein EH223_04485 [candidate division KSB1 bacterium]|nr:hypothetical protein [candidate division KSB1 bacterium]RQW05538.1 MAG: hypothetical protein EH223_04485 [candidate division KSB1 bacterium]
MKNLYCTIIVIIFFLPLLANETVNFSGQWSFDKARSEFGQGGDRFVPLRLNIMQSDSMMMVVRSYQREYDDDFIDTLSFSLDGKENHSEFWHSPRVITANWQEGGCLLTIKTWITFTHEDQESEIFSTDIWKLDKNGSALTRDFTINGPLGEMKAIYIFTKTD